MGPVAAVASSRRMLITAVDGQAEMHSFGVILRSGLVVTSGFQRGAIAGGTEECKDEKYDNCGTD